MSLPHSRCNWIIQNKVMLGASPLKEHFQLLLDAGIDVFVNLQEKHEWYTKESCFKIRILSQSLIMVSMKMR